MKKVILPLVVVIMFLAMGMQRNRYEPENRLAYYAVDTASNDTYLAQVSGVDRYYAGLFIMLNPVTDNTGACTLNINGLGAKVILDSLGSNTPANNYIDEAGITTLCYDGTNFVITSNDANP